MPPLPPDQLAALVAPLPGDQPAGEDLRYDARYAAIKEARREDEELPQGGLATERKVADWGKVVAETTALLSAETKDLQLAAWLTEALLKREGLAGLAQGLGVLHGLLDGLWDHVHPVPEDEEDIAARTGPLAWVGGKLDVAVKLLPVAKSGLTLVQHATALGVPRESEDSKEKKAARAEALAEGKVPPEEAEQAIADTPKAYYKALVADVTAALAALDTLETLTDEKFRYDDPPSFRALRSALDEVQRLAQSTLAAKLALDPDPVEEAPLDPADVGTYAPPADGVGDGTIAAEPASRTDAAARVGAVAKWLRAQDPTDPTSYALLRAARWAEVRPAEGGAPGTPDPRLLEAPPPATRTRLKGLLLDGKWPELLELGEQAMATPAGRGWLDLQRYVLTACTQLGPTHAAVAAAVRRALAAHLATFPALPTQTLMDDTPAANDETRAWLEREGLTGEGGDDASDDEDAAPDDDEAPAEETYPDGSETLDAALSDEEDGEVLAERARGTATRRRPRRAGARPAGNGYAPGAAPDVFALARAEAGRGRTQRALELLVAELERERSARGRFVRETQIAALMIEAGMAEVARPIVKRLLDTVETRELENWEAGALVAQPMVLMCRIIDATDGDEDDRLELYQKICRLDPLQALALRRG